MDERAINPRNRANAKIAIQPTWLLLPRPSCGLSSLVMSFTYLRMPSDSSFPTPKERLVRHIALHTAIGNATPTAT